MPLSCVSHHHHTYTYLSCASPSVHPAYDPSSSDILFSRKCLVSIPNPLKRGGDIATAGITPSLKNIWLALPLSCVQFCAHKYRFGEGFIFISMEAATHFLPTLLSATFLWSFQKSVLVTDCREIRGGKIKGL